MQTFATFGGLFASKIVLKLLTSHIEVTQTFTIKFKAFLEAQLPLIFNKQSTDILTLKCLDRQSFTAKMIAVG